MKWPCQESPRQVARRRARDVVGLDRAEEPPRIGQVYLTRDDVTVITRQDCAIVYRGGKKVVVPRIFK